MSMDRTVLQATLESVMELNGYTPHVYYQPPESVKLVYPCIVYGRDNYKTTYANDVIYKDATKYSVTVMDKNPVSSLVDALRKLRYSKMEREFTSDNIHHFLFTLYY